MPAPVTVALPLLMLHVPPPASVNAVVKPAHTLSVPSIAVGNGFTVTVVVIIHVVGKV